MLRPYRNVPRKSRFLINSFDSFPGTPLIEKKKSCTDYAMGKKIFSGRSSSGNKSTQRRLNQLLTTLSSRRHKNKRTQSPQPRGNHRQS